MHLIALARWLARNAVTAEWKSQGRKVEFVEITEAANVYFMEHGKELIEEARAHPVAIHYRQQERIRLARKAVIAEIRERGGKVNSIAPEELRKLVEAYLKEHPWENVVMERGCVLSLRGVFVFIRNYEHSPILKLDPTMETDR